MRLKLGVLLTPFTIAVASNGNWQSNSTGYAVKTPPLTTPWTYQLNLNGIWNYQNASSLDAVNSPPFNRTLLNEVLIPSCLESGLSGIQGTNMLYSWFSTSFTLPASSSGQTLLLNFGAVDYEASVFINGQHVGFNRGGYYKFTVDVTSFAKCGQKNKLFVFVHDPTDSGDYVIPIGKQTLRPSHIFYTPCSGIWQSVWIEPAPADHVTQHDVDADMHCQVNITVHSSSGSPSPVSVAVYESGTYNIIASHNATSGTAFQFHIPAEIPKQSS